jgi:hypothetical protein
VSDEARSESREFREPGGIADPAGSRPSAGDEATGTSNDERQRVPVAEPAEGFLH